MMVNVLYLFLLVSAVSAQQSALRRRCDPIDEIECDDGYCIFKPQWCDSVLDCRDGSDEAYCHGVNDCLPIHFSCGNGKCVPSSAVCDKYDDCFDGSDEEDCDDDAWMDVLEESTAELASINDSVLLADAPEQLSNTSQDAVVKAVRYLMDMRDSDYAWGAFTPRAVVALSFASKASPVADEEKQLMQKQLNIQLLLDLMENQNSMSVSSLAMYINALHSTCQDPRNFQGVDLVARLRMKVDIGMKSNYSIPLAYLTLCLSRETKYEDGVHLANIYNTQGFKRTSSRALIILAMLCVERKDNSRIFRHYVEDFFTYERAKVQVADIYAQALFTQASNAAGTRAPIDLVSKQLPDGSFGDMLATYYAIPALLNASLLELKCSNEKGVRLDNQVAKVIGEKKVAYSLWISSGKDATSHSLTIEFDGDKTFFDIMRMAAARDPMFRFLYDEDADGKKVYSLAGIPNDIERGSCWILFSGHMDTVKVNSVQSLLLEVHGVDKIKPEDKEHFVFWLKRDSV